MSAFVAARRLDGEQVLPSLSLPPSLPLGRTCSWVEETVDEVGMKVASYSGGNAGRKKDRWRMKRRRKRKNKME